MIMCSLVNGTNQEIARGEDALEHRRGITYVLLRGLGLYEYKNVSALIQKEAEVPFQVQKSII